MHPCSAICRSGACLCCQEAHTPRGLCWNSASFSSTVKRPRNEGSVAASTAAAATLRTLTGALARAAARGSMRSARLAGAMPSHRGMGKLPA